MLIRLSCDGTCDFLRRLGVAELQIDWIVEEDVPLRKSAQLKSLNTAIRNTRGVSRQSTASDADTNPDSAAVETFVKSFAAYTLTIVSSGEAVDVRRTPRELSLQDGAALRLAGEKAPQKQKSNNSTSRASHKREIMSDSRASHKSERADDNRASRKSERVAESRASHKSERVDDSRASRKSEIMSDSRASHKSERADDGRASRKSEIMSDSRASHKSERADDNRGGGGSERAPSSAGSESGGGSDRESGGEERYVSRSAGWFPFLLRPREGAPLALVGDPTAPLRAEDAEPPAQPLCDTCGELIAHGDAFRVAVDQHRKPMCMQQNFLEVCMEKLGGGQLQRWQTRYVQMSEKSVDWFAEKPRPGLKNRIHGHRYLVRDGGCELTAIIPNPDPHTYPKCKDERFFHFGIRFCNPDKTYFFRVTTPDLRETVLHFIDNCVKLAHRRAPVRNPVEWKQRADAFLLNAAQLGELYAQSHTEAEAVREQTEAVEKTLDAVLEDKAHILKDLSSHVGAVNALRAELAESEAAEKIGKQRIRVAEERLAAERRLLREKETEMGDEMRKAAALKSHAVEQRAEAEKRIAELRARAAELQRRESEVFRKWRALEEQHRTRTPASAPGTGLFAFSRESFANTAEAPRTSAAQFETGRVPSRVRSSSSPRRILFHSTSRERSLGGEQFY